MKKRIATLAVLLIAAILALLPFAQALAQSVVCTNADWQYSISAETNHHTFTLLGLRWVFYNTDGTQYLVYRYSSDDGDTWSSQQSTGLEFYAIGRHSLDMAYDGSIFHITWINTSGFVHYRSATPYGNGTLSWGTDYDITGYKGTSYTSISIALDSNNKPFVSYTWLTAFPTGYIGVTASSTGGGVWTTRSGAPWEITGGSYNYYGAQLYGLTGGKMAIAWDYIYDYYGYHWYQLYMQRFDGANWLAAAATTSQPHGSTAKYNTDGMSGVAVGDNVTVVWLDHNDYHLMVSTWAYSTNTWGTELELYDQATDGSTLPIIAKCTDDNNLLVWWERHPDSDSIYYAYYDASISTWYSYWEVVHDITDHLSTARSDFIMADQYQTEDEKGFYYLAGGEYGKILKFKLMGEQFVVSTNPADGIDDEGHATLHGSIDSISWGTPTERGFYWDTAASLGNTTGTLQHWYETGNFSVGDFSHSISGLEWGTKYYFIAYAINAETAYGSWRQFYSGEQNGWLIETLDPENITYKTATLKGNLMVIPDGTACTERGFEWDYTATETPEWEWHVDGTFSTGTFTYSGPDLKADNIYYYRAKAGNSTFTAYGNWIGFITSIGPNEESDYYGGGNETFAPLPDQPSGFYLPDLPTFTGSKIPFVNWITEFFQYSSLPVAYLWWLVLLTIVTFLSLWLYDKSKAIFVIVIFQGGFLALIMAFAWLDWYLIIPFIIFGLGSLLQERSFSFG